MKLIVRSHGEFVAGKPVVQRLESFNGMFIIIQAFYVNKPQVIICLDYGIIDNLSFAGVNGMS